MKTEIVPFTEDMVAEAAVLLAQRHQRQRQRLPHLPLRFEESEVAAQALTSLLQKPTTRGYAATRAGKLVAYLLGEWTAEPWGRCGWMRLPGSALAEGESPATLQDLYIRLGDDWTKQGVFIHHIYLSTADRDVIEAWFSLDFGKERIDAILDFREITIPPVSIPAGIEIRRAGPGDNALLSGLSHVIYQELAKAPYWHPTPPEVWPELAEGWAELADDPTLNIWLALEGDKAWGTIGFWAYEAAAEDMLASAKMSYLSVAATLEAARGRGIATALTWTGLAHCRDQGDAYCISNWISPNLSASRFWPRFGFQEVAYRLTRNLNPMIAWTRRD
jgi:GNAT superfamily N-acetyltransferase